MASAAEISRKVKRDADSGPFQVSCLVRSANTLEDQQDECLGITYAKGVLQSRDRKKWLGKFAHLWFLTRVIQGKRDLWESSPMRVYQIQQEVEGSMRVHGTIVTDGSHHLVDYCVETDPPRFAKNNREIVTKAIEALCIPKVKARAAVNSASSTRPIA